MRCAVPLLGRRAALHASGAVGGDLHRPTPERFVTVVVGAGEAR